jgi:sigma-54 dependent transcriptional regulator, flagellar regulatory protein
VQTVECIGAPGEGIARNAEDRRAGTSARENEGVMLPTGSSAAIAAVNRLIEQVAPYDSTVLILGESGTGKEIAARAIHAASPRRQRPFVAVNCGAIPAELLESELFGHEKGSFTGAITSRKGRFEIAEGGTLFLDEIGDMSLPMQVKLLRVLQERIYERVGSNASSHCDVRIIAATHRNLEESIVRGSFRGDLFYRLNVFPIEMPTLATRIGDLPALIDDFVAHAAGRGRPRLRLLPETLEALGNYPWPGNIRELSNLIERLAILCPERPVGIGDLPSRYRPADWTAPNILPPLTEEVPQLLASMAGGEDLEDEAVLPASVWNCEQESPTRLPENGVDLRAHLTLIERSLISQALQRSGGTVAHAARLLSLRRTTLVEKLRKLGMAGA